MAGKPLSIISEKERWWAALSYIFSPILPATLVFILDLNEYPFLKKHIYQSMAMGIIFVLTMPLILAATLCIGGLFWLIMPYWGMLAFNGHEIAIPWVSTWIKEQGFI